MAEGHNPDATKRGDAEQAGSQNPVGDDTTEQADGERYIEIDGHREG